MWVQATPFTARLNVDGFDLVVGQPTLEFLGDELRAIVRADGLRRPVLGDGALHEIDDVAGF